MSYQPAQPPPYSYEPSYPLTTSGWAIASLIAGVLGWIGVFGLGGVVAVITGHIAKNEIRNSMGRVGGSGIATAGLVLGYLNIALTVLSICLFVLIFTGVISGAAICPFVFGSNSFE